MDEQDWDETETEEQREARMVEMIEKSRALWFVWKDPDEQEQNYFVGVWELIVPYDPGADQALLEGLPDWPEGGKAERIEIHRLAINERPDNYQPDKYLEHAFRTVAVKRPDEQTITEKEKQGDVTVLRLTQHHQITTLRLSRHIDPD